MADENSAEGGRLIGGQFRAQGAMDSFLGYQYVECIDETNSSSVGIRLVSRGDLERLGAALRMQKDVKRAGSLVHKNIARVMGFGKDGGDLFVVEESVVGYRLSHLLNRRRESGRPFGLKEAFYLTIHLCNALGHATDSLPHGLLAPSHIVMRKDGRPKVIGFGLAALLPGIVNDVSLLDWDQVCLTDHLQSPAQRDLYALGRIFYALLKNGVDTERSFAEQVEVDDALTPGMIRLLLRCAGDGDVKPLAGPSEFREELHNVVSEMFQTLGDEPKRTASTGPPPMPSELDDSVVAKPMGMDLIAQGHRNEASEEMSELRWMYRLQDQEFGPVSGQQLVAKLNANELTAYAPIRDIEKTGFRSMAEVPFFKKATDSWTSEASLRESRIKEIADAETKRVAKRRILFVALTLLIVGSFVYSGQSIIRFLEPTPVSLELDDLIAYKLPIVKVPQRVESDPDFKAKLKAYDAVMATRPKKKWGGNKAYRKTVGGSIVDFSNAATSQGQVEEEMTRRLYSSLSRHMGLLSCLQSALPEGTKRRSFNVQVTVLPNGALTEIRMPGASMSVSACVRKVLSNYKVRSIQGVTVTATLPFTVQR
jgi:serine/threonine protein kinase